METSLNLHPFESAGLGKSPFRYVGYDVKVGPIRCDDGMTQIGSPGQPMGTCDYCGQGIAICVSIQSIDGKLFTVGQDCAEKLYRETNRPAAEIARDPIYKAMKAAKRERDRKLRHAREAVKLADGAAWFAEHEAAAATLPSPNTYRANQGETLADFVRWFAANAGTTGKLRAYATARKAIESAAK